MIAYKFATGDSGKYHTQSIDSGGQFYVIFHTKRKHGFPFFWSRLLTLEEKSWEATTSRY